jgi:hypothetical protein
MKIVPLLGSRIRRSAETSEDFPLRNELASFRNKLSFYHPGNRPASSTTEGNLFTSTDMKINILENKL